MSLLERFAKSSCGLLTADEIWELKPLTNMVKKVQCPLSYGLEPNGYTIRIGNEFLIPQSSKTLDPMDKEKTQQCFAKAVKDKFFLLKPKSFVLAKSIEKFNLPNDVSAIALTKSSYARVGVFANITTIDAGFKGDLVIEIANLGYTPVKIWAGYGIAEVLFFRHKPTDGYKGNYQNHEGIKV